MFCCIVCFDIELYELFVYLEINPLSVVSFANIFSQNVGCLFILFMVSFAVQKLLGLIRSYWFSLGFVSIILGDRTKKILLQCMSKNILPIFFH